jgi:hypothetical protein
MKRDVSKQPVKVLLSSSRSMVPVPLRAQTTRRHPTMERNVKPKPHALAPRSSTLLLNVSMLAQLSTKTQMMVSNALRKPTPTLLPRMTRNSQRPMEPVLRRVTISNSPPLLTQNAET